MKYGRARNAYARRQRGFTLVVGLIMLVLLTLIALATFRLGMTQTIVVSNSQQRNEALDAAQQAIDTAINSNSFTISPAAAIAQSNCAGGGTNSLCVDANGDGKQDIRVTLSPPPGCIKAAPIPVNELAIETSEEDLKCIAGGSQDFGIERTKPTGNSLCANSLWELNAVASDQATGASVTVSQGVSVRIATSSMQTNCP